MQSKIIQLSTTVSELRTLALAGPFVTPTDLRRIREAHAILGQVIVDLEAAQPALTTVQADTAAGEYLPPDA